MGGMVKNVSQWLEKTGVSDVAENIAPYAAPFAIPGIGSMLAGLPGIGATGGAMLAGAGVSSAFGGDPVKGAFMGGLNQVLGSFGPETNIGKFVRSPIGSVLINGLLGSGGNFGQLGGLLEGLGISGKQKDFVETILAIVGLAGISDLYAKDAINAAKALEERESETIMSILEAGKELMPTTEQEEKEIAVQIENVAREFGRAREAFISRAAQTGMARGGGLAGQLRRMSEEEAGARLGAERAVQLQRPQRTLASLQAQAAVLPYMRGQAAQARTGAEEMRRFPFEIAADLMAAQREDPLTQYLKSQQLAAAGGGDAGGGFQLGDLGLGDYAPSWGAQTPYVGGGMGDISLIPPGATDFTLEGLPMRSTDPWGVPLNIPSLSNLTLGTPNLPFR